MDVRFVEEGTWNRRGGRAARRRGVGRHAPRTPWLGLKGPYPPYLSMPTQEFPDLPAGHLPFLDLKLIEDRATRFARYITHLYDKRYQRAFTGIRLTRFIAAASNVNDQSKRSLLDGQFHRLRRVITDPLNFCSEMAFVLDCLTQVGHPQRMLRRRYERLLRDNPHAYVLARIHERLDLLTTTVIRWDELVSQRTARAPARA